MLGNCYNDYRKSKRKKRFAKPMKSALAKSFVILPDSHCNEYRQISMEICPKIKDLASK